MPFRSKSSYKSKVSKKNTSQKNRPKDVVLSEEPSRYASQAIREVVNKYNLKKGDDFSFQTVVGMMEIYLIIKEVATYLGKGRISDIPYPVQKQIIKEFKPSMKNILSRYSRELYRVIERHAQQVAEFSMEFVSSYMEQDLEWFKDDFIKIVTEMDSFKTELDEIKKEIIKSEEYKERKEIIRQEIINEYGKVHKDLLKDDLNDLLDEMIHEKSIRLLLRHLDEIETDIDEDWWDDPKESGVKKFRSIMEDVHSDLWVDKWFEVWDLMNQFDEREFSLIEYINLMEYIRDLEHHGGSVLMDVADMEYTGIEIDEVSEFFDLLDDYEKNKEKVHFMLRNIKRKIVSKPLQSQETLTDLIKKGVISKKGK
jgi:hypothetical protein